MALSQAALDLVKKNLAQKKGLQEKTSSEENKTGTTLSQELQAIVERNVALKKMGNDSSGSKARVSAPVSSYSLEIGKNGYNRYLSDKQREAQKKQEEEDNLEWWERVFRYMGSSPDSTLVGSNMTLATEALREDTSWKEPSDEWNNEERYTFGWLYQSDKKAAEEYAAKVNNAINKAKTDAEREEIKKGVSESFDKSTGTAFVDAAGKTISSVANSAIGGADFLYDLAEKTARGQITEKDYLTPFERSQVGTEAVANELNTRGGTIKEDVPIVGGKGWGDVYGLGTSIAQSSVAAYTGGAPQALIQFFGSAAATGVDDARARGASDDQAIAFGIASGLAEAIPEAIGIDNLLKIGSSSTLKSLMLNIVKQSGVEGIEEGTTSIINNLADNIIMGDFSNFNALKWQYRIKGMSEEEAKKQAWIDTVEGIAFDSLAGFVSGGIHAGPQTAFQTVMANREAVSTYGESVSELIEEGLSTPVGTRSHELAQEYKAKLDQKKTLSGAEIRMMVEANENQFTAEDTAKIQEAAENRLRELGESDNVSAIAQILTKQAGGETISKAQQKVLDASKYGQRVANEMNPQNIRSGGYASEWTRNIGTERINADLYNLAQETAGVNKGAETAQKNAGAKVSASEVNSPTKTKTVVQGEYKASDNGKTISNETGAETSVAEITSIKGGKMTLKLENGEEVDAKNVSFGSQGEALVYETVANLPNMDAASANFLVKNMDLGKAPADVYARGIEEAYTFGTHNIPVTEMMDDVAFFKDLTEQQRMQAYRLGQNNHKAATQVKEETVRKNQTVAEKKAGRVHFEGDIESLNKRQKASYDAIERIADALGIEIYLFESPVVNGKRKGANGWYDTKDGSIHLDIYAGQNGEGTMLFTLAHELTHFIKQWSPAKFDILADFLMEEYGKKGVSVNELVRAQQEKARRNKRELSYDEAFEEVVADSMETMLADSEVMEKLEKLKAQDQTLWEKIKDFIADLVKKIKEVYAGLTPNSEEGQYVAEMVDAIERIQELFTEGITEAAENFRTIGSIDLEQFAEAKNTDGEQLFQYRAMEEDEDTYRSMLKKWGKFSDAQINNLFTTIDKAMDIIKDNLEILDYAWEADINDRAFSPVKPNSDSLYQVSIDFSTLCRKRLLQQTVQAQLQEALKRPMTKEEGIAIRDALMAIQEEGRQIEIACALCYVESARMKSPAQIKKFLGNREAVLKDFFATKSGGDIKGKIKQAEADARERLGVGDASLKSLSNKVADQIRAAKKEAKASYMPTAEEQKLIDAAMKMTVSDFTTPAGLENLAKNYRGIFDAYTSYVRNATKSKGIENDTWWRAGDSEKIGDTLIANMNKENGLRSQSWSDFQVIHMMDYIAAVIELSTRNSKMQAYTKVPDYVELMGKTGAMINLSLIPTRDYLGTLDYDSTEGMDYRKSLELRDKYHGTVGTICIGIDNNQIKQLLEDMTIDYVIPYHKSGMSAHVRKAMHLPTWSEYELYQSESNLSDAEAKANADKYGVKLLDKSDPDYHKHTSFSEWFDLKEAQQIAKMENAHPSDPAKKKKYGVMYGGYMAMQNAANNYLKLCAERGLAPVFSHKKADFTGEDNYWKVLIDRKMVDNITGEVIEQKAIQPVFDEAEVLRILNDELERYPKVKEDQEYAIRRVTEKFLSGEVKGGMSSAAVAKAMQKPVDNITETNIVEAGKEMDGVKLSDMEFSKEFVTDTVNSFGINKLGDYIHVQRQVFDTLTNEGFFTDTEARSRTDVNEDSGMVIETNKSGIDETFSLQNYARVGKNKKITKLATIRMLPEMIRYGKLVGDDVENLHNPADTNKKFAYISYTANIDGKDVPIKLTVKKSLEKNKFWVHSVEIKNVSNYPAGSDNTTGAGYRIADNGKSIASEDGNVKNSLRDVEHVSAPTFYSYMGKVVDGIKSEKVGAGGVIPYLKGKGVKDEEIKWSGIEAFLEGKKSVTKQELQEFVAGSMLQIEEQLLFDEEVPFTKEEQEQISKYEAERDIIAENLKSEWKRIVGKDIPIVNFVAGLESAVFNNLFEANADKKGETEVGYKYRAAKAALQRVIEDNNEDWGYDTNRQAFREAVRNPESFMSANEMSSFQESVFKDFIKAKKAYDKEEGIPIQEQKALLGIAASADRISYRINKIREENRAKRVKRMPIWEQYKLRGGKNYRELKFIMPNSSYTNQAMQVHWGYDAEGVLVHTRVQDFETDKGTMLFIEELQSDWHNEGHKKGYVDESKKLNVKNTEVRLENGWYNLYHDGRDLHQGISEAFLKQRFAGGITKEEIHEGLVDEYNRAMEHSGNGWKASDAPFKTNYHEFVLKRLIREAAEKGYDSIGWTPAKIQEERWSEEFAEGYRIEYDQDMPAFLKKYGKKWGAKVDKTELENGETIWFMPITDAMKESVLTEGQPLYQERSDIADRNRAVVLEKKAERLEKELKDLERAYEKAQDYARAEGVLAGQIEQGAKMAKELRQKQEAFNRKAEGYEESIIAKRIKIAEIRAQRDELLEKARAEKREAVANARQKAAETQREIITRYQESRKKAVESRHQTEMRHKIKGVVNELNQLLLHGTKDRHVMIGLQKAAAQALDAVNMDTLGAEERIAKYDALIAKANDPDVIASLTATRDRIRKQGDNFHERIAQLKAAYADIKNSDDPLIANGYDEVIASKIDSVVSTVGDTPLRSMSMEQLEAVYDMYKMVLTRIRDANKSFTIAKKETISALANRVMMEVEHVGGKHDKWVKGSEKIRGFSWNNLKPVYAFERIGSKTFTEVFKSVRAGEDTFAKDVTEAKEFFQEKRDKYHYDKWDMNKKVSFKSKTGQSFSLTLEQIMSLYAYSKRKQADKHLELGGFVFDSNIEVVEKKKGIPVKYTVNTATAHQISRDVLGNIISKLTPEQKAFVDEMQDYLSSTMGAKGNEISLAMYGVKLFKEKFYFPLKSAKQFMFEQNETAGEVRIKNSGFSKETVAHANNPIILSNFMDVWSGHVNDMSMYHSFVLPLEDFNRVFNYKTPTVDGMDTESVKQFIQNAYGTEANKYISELIKDLNGGAVSDPRETTAKKLISNFKKAAVFTSASVVVQQPSAIGRALALLDVKYFIGGKIGAKGHKKAWEEAKKYAPVAIIKEMGYFDTDMGRSTEDFITAKEYKGLNKVKGLVTDSAYRDEVLSVAPALADEVTWVAIWNAVKRETKAKNKTLVPGSEEFLKAAGERFTEVITKTQVYDSVLSRSANMRSKSTFMSMWTSFLGEPTTSINMLEDALRQGKRGKKGYAAKTIAAVYASMLINSALVSLVYAARDDDEDETYLEKYLESLTKEVLEGINPLTYLPFFRDIWSAMQGFDIERADMSLIVKIIDSARQAMDVIRKDTEDMTEEELAEHQKAVRDSLLNVAVDISSLTGLPIKNLIRDYNGAINLFKTIEKDVHGRQSTVGSILDNIGDGLRDSIPFGLGGSETKADKLYEAIMAGDEVYEARLRESTPEYQLRGALRGNDPRIREAAQAKIDGDMQTYLKLAKEVIADGFSQNDVVRAINTQITNMSKEETETESTDNSLTGFFTVDEYLEAVLGRDQASANAIKNDIINTSIANGRDRETAEEKFYSSLYYSIKDAYDEGSISADKAKEVFVKYGNKTETSANSTVDLWEFKKDYPDTPVESYYLDKYYESIADSGVDIKTYVDYRNEAKNCKGTDKDGDGKTDSGSVKAQKLPIINALPITKEQKDAIYYSEGWAKSTIHEAPWR